MGALLTLDSFRTTFPIIDTLAPSATSNTSTIQGMHGNGSPLQVPWLDLTGSGALGTIVSLYALGAIFGSIIAVFIGDRLGRRRTIILGQILLVVGYAIQSSAFDLGQLIVGRILTGLGIGLSSATIPIYQSECSDSAHRGAFVVLEGTFIIAGVAISSWLDFGFFFVHNTANWRFPLAFGAFFPLVALCFIFHIPESPRWLIKKDRIEEARGVYAALNHCDATDSRVDIEIGRTRLSLQQTGEARFKDLFTMGPNRLLQRVTLAVVILVFLELTGTVIIGYYSEVIFEEYLKLSAITSRILACTTFTWGIIASMIPYFLIDRFGRRPLMLWAAIGLSVSMAGIAACVAHPGQASGSVATFFIFLFQGAYSIGYFGLPFLYSVEVAPLAHRVYINGISSAAVWLVDFAVAMMTPVALNNIGYRYFVIFAIMNGAVILPGKCFPPPAT
jgi:sugar porter (SP) family MFS transporter